MFSFSRKNKLFFSEDDHRLIVNAIRQAEKATSGEVRVYVESRCPWMDALDRAAEIFFALKMDKTALRNAVLVYVAIKDRQLAVFGDEGIHQKVGTGYWKKLVENMAARFDKEDYVKGIVDCVMQIGTALHTHFPYNAKTDKNELPDEIVFGR